MGKRTFTDCWWECKIAHPFQREIHIKKKKKNQQFYHLGMYTKTVIMDVQILHFSNQVFK